MLQALLKIIHRIHNKIHPYFPSLLSTEVIPEYKCNHRSSKHVLNQLSHDEQRVDCN